MSTHETKLETAALEVMTLRDAVKKAAKNKSQNTNVFFTDPTMEWSARVKTARIAKKLSQQELADLLQVHPGVIVRLENGYVERVKRNFLPPLADALGVDTSWIMTGIGKGVDKEVLPPPERKKMMSSSRVVGQYTVVPGYKWSEERDGKVASYALQPRLYSPDLIDQLPAEMRNSLFWAYHRKGENKLNPTGGDVVLLASHHCKLIPGVRLMSIPGGHELVMYHLTKGSFDESAGPIDPSIPTTLLCRSLRSEAGILTLQILDEDTCNGLIIHRQSFDVAVPLDTSSWPKSKPFR